MTNCCSLPKVFNQLQNACVCPSQTQLRYTISQSFESEDVQTYEAAFKAFLSLNDGSALDANFIRDKIPDLRVLKVSPAEDVKKIEFR